MKFRVAIFVFVCFLVFGIGDGIVSANTGIPPWPTIYSGPVTIAGDDSLDGYFIEARAGTHVSARMEINGGRYVGLAMGAPSQSFVGTPVTFHLIYPDGNDTGLVAIEIHAIMRNLTGPILISPYPLTFPALPLPTPTPTPVPTATPMPTATPVPTATPIPTATPVIVRPSIYSGLIIVPGILDYEGALTVRIGGYESFPVPVVGGGYTNLVVDAIDPNLLGQKMTFYLDGFEARTSHILGNGEKRSDLDLIFTAIPQAPVPTVVVTEKAVIKEAPVVPTPVVISANKVKTEVSKPIKQKDDQMMDSATATPVVVVKEVVVIATPTVEALKGDGNEGSTTDNEVESVGSGCNKPEDAEGGMGGAVNALAFLGPVLALAVLRRRKKAKRE